MCCPPSNSLFSYLVERCRFFQKGIIFSSDTQQPLGMGKPARVCVRRPDESHASAIPIEYRV